MDTKQQKTHRPYSEFGFVPNGLPGKRTKSVNVNLVSLKACENQNVIVDHWSVTGNCAL